LQTIKGRSQSTQPKFFSYLFKTPFTICLNVNN